MKLSYIDALRGIAILMVILVHTGQYGSNPSSLWLTSFINQGARGVQLFYVASAFTLFLSYHYRQSREVHARRNFFIRRFFRIAPMYYLGIIYFLFQNGLGPRYELGDAPGVTAANILANVFFVHGANPYWITSLVPGGWSITVEMTFYLTIPFLVLWIKSFNRAVTFTLGALVVSLILGTLLMRFPLIEHDKLWYLYLFYYFPSQLPVFGFGIMAYFLIIHKDQRLSSRNLIFLALVLLSQFVWKRTLPEHVLFGAGFLILMLALSRRNFGIIDNRLTRFMGKISYSSYLVHFAVLHWLNYFHWVDVIPSQGTVGLMLNLGIRLVMVVGLTAGISWALLHAVEIPCQKLGKKWIARLSSDHPVKSVMKVVNKLVDGANPAESKG